MKRYSLGNVWLSVLPPLGDAALLYGSLGAALSLRRLALIDSRAFLSQAAEFTPIFLVCIGTFHALGLYELRAVRDLVTLTGNLLVSSAILLFLGANYFYLRSTYHVYTPKTNLLLTVLISHAAVFAWRRIWMKLIDFKLLDQRVVFLGDEAQVRLIEDHLKRWGMDIGFSPVQWAWPGVDLVVADGRWVDRKWDKARDVFISAIRHKVPMISFEAFYESLFGKVSPDFAANPSWTLEFVTPKIHGLYPAVKRLIDLAATTVLLSFLWPLMALICLAILLLDGSPALYGQRRVGYLGQEFVLWKFRTMTLQADRAGPFTSAREIDTRVTRLGHFLRRYRLDELPQLWNVFRGEMSLVGPRPEWVKEVEVLKKTVPNYHLRYLVHPGITGWAQVYFRATNNTWDSLEKLHYDLYYVKYFSPAVDLSILLKTIRRIFIRDALFASLSIPLLGRSAARKRWAGDLSSAGGRK